MSQTNQNNSEKQKEIINSWIPKVRTALRTSASRLTEGKVKPFVMRYNGKKKEQKLMDSIVAKPKIKYGDVYAVSFSFERHGVFVSKGVGKSHGINQGFVMRGGKRRIPKDWFNPVLEDYIPELADRLTEVNADATVEAVAMKIL